MFAKGRRVAPKVPCERTRAEVADRTNFEDDAPGRQQIHQRWIMNRADPVPDTLHSEEFDRVANQLRTTDLSGVNQFAQTTVRSMFVDDLKVLGWNTQLISTNSKGDDAG